MCVHGSEEAIILDSKRYMDDNDDWDQCTMAEWTIARAAAKEMLSKFRYCGNRKWEFFDPDKKQWIVDQSNNKIKAYLRLHASEKLRTRAAWWHSQGTDFDNQHRSLKLLEIAQKIYKDPFMNKLLKELQCFLSSS